MATCLHSLTLKGFKSIASLVDFKFGPLTALIGPNGAGKSNLIDFFRMLAWLRSPNGKLQRHIGIQGGASFIVHDGLNRTTEIHAELTLHTDAGENQYAMNLVHAAKDTMIFDYEAYRFSRMPFETKAKWIELGSGHKESALPERADEGDQTARVIRNLLNQLIVYQFHNTSFSSRIRGKWSIEDGRHLKEDGANIASFLYRLFSDMPKHYRRIVSTIQLILPFLDDFVFEEEDGMLLLQWREVDSDMVFNASQASDGMLRIVVLVALLLQPKDNLPNVLILDEPELGLHPLAISIIGGLIQSISLHGQVLVATQSAALLDCFETENVVVVERRGRESHFARLDPEKLQAWLEDYSLSELWEKNVIGGRPR